MHSRHRSRSSCAKLAIGSPSSRAFSPSQTPFRTTWSPDTTQDCCCARSFARYRKKRLGTAGAFLRLVWTCATQRIPPCHLRRVRTGLWQRDFSRSGPRGGRRSHRRPGNRRRGVGARRVAGTLQGNGCAAVPLVRSGPARAEEILGELPCDVCPRTERLLPCERVQTFRT